MPAPAVLLACRYSLCVPANSPSHPRIAFAFETWQEEMTKTIKTANGHRETLPLACRLLIIVCALEHLLEW